MTNEIIEMAEQPRALMAQSAPATPADIVLYAMKNGGSIAEIREFMQLQREWEADEARKAFVAAMAEFKKSPPEVVKDKQVAFKGTSYTHASLGNVTEAIVAGLACNGFSHRWELDQQGPNITVTCVLTHKLGHCERTPMTAQKDDSGAKNGIQQVASTITYLQRYTLLAATGVATKDQSDNDGAGFGTPDTSLADEWIAKVNAAPTDDDVVKVWNLGSVKFEAAKDTHGYSEFRDAIAKRRAELEPKA